MIGPGRARFEIRFEAVGALQVGVEDPPREDYSGELVFRLRRGSDVSYLAFDRAPYVAENLPAGDYELYLERAPGVDRRRQLHVAFRIEPGEIATPRFLLTR